MRFPATPRSRCRACSGPLAVLSLAEIRAEVDATLGGNGVPGTPTDLPTD
jgi:hypothetical protein